MSTKTFIVSDESVNSYGFRVLTAGIKTDAFAKNPVMLFNHNFDKVIGKWNNLKINGSQLTGQPEFDSEDSEAVKIQSKVNNGYIKGASMGIRVLKHVGDVIQECELKEISITALPSNSNAFALFDYNNHQLNESQVRQLMNSGTTNFNLNPVSAPILKLKDQPANSVKSKTDARNDLLIQLSNTSHLINMIDVDLQSTIPDLARKIEIDNFGTTSYKSIDGMMAKLHALSHLSEWCDALTLGIKAISKTI